MLLPTRVTAGTPIVHFGRFGPVEDATTLSFWEEIRGHVLVRFFALTTPTRMIDILDLCVFQQPASSYSILSVHTNVYFLLLSEWSTGTLQKY